MDITGTILMSIYGIIVLYTILRIGHIHSRKYGQLTSRKVRSRKVTSRKTRKIEGSRKRGFIVK